MLTWKQVEEISALFNCGEYVAENKKMVDRMRAAQRYLEAVASGKESKDAKRMKSARLAEKGVVDGATKVAYEKTYNSRIKSMLKKDFRDLSKEDLSKVFTEIQKVTGSQLIRESSRQENSGQAVMKNESKPKVDMSEVMKNPYYSEYMMYSNSLEVARKSGFWSDITKHPFYDKYCELKGKLGL